MPTRRIKHLIALALLAATLIALAAVALTSGAEPGSDPAPERAKQPVAIVSKGVDNAAGAGDFVHTPLAAGALRRDSGTTSATWSHREVMRAGQSVAIDTTA
jgi:hypothetical protein